jgi:hypothetical protein
MPSSFPIRANLALAALLVCSAAAAQSSVTSTIDLAFSLRDLDPSDGIAPTLTFDPNSRSTAVWGTDGAGGVTSSPQQGASAFGAVSSSGMLDGSGGSASFSGDPFAAPVQITASAFAGSLFVNGSGRAYVSTPGSDPPPRFMLSPHTQVALLGHTTVDWDAGSPVGAAFGEIDLAISASSSSGDISMRYATAGYYGDGDGDVSGSSSDDIFVTYTNDSDAPQAVAYDVDVFANASQFETVLPPVDEPSGLALVLAGASALAWGLRRRR